MAFRSGFFPSVCDREDGLPEFDLRQSADLLKPTKAALTWDFKCSTLSAILQAFAVRRGTHAGHILIRPLSPSGNGGLSCGRREVSTLLRTLPSFVLAGRSKQAGGQHSESDKPPRVNPA